MAYHLNLPVRNAIVEMDLQGKESPLAAEKYYIPGSILNAEVNQTTSATWGMPEKTDIYFNNSPVFKISTEALTSTQVKPLLWFSTQAPLRSGWAWGQAYLRDGVTAFEAQVGKGEFFAFGPEITFRAQTHGTFRLLFNQLYNHSAY